MLLQLVIPSSSESLPEPEPRQVRLLHFIQHNLVVPVQQEISTRFSGTFAVYKSTLSVTSWENRYFVVQEAWNEPFCTN